MNPASSLPVWALALVLLVACGCESTVDVETTDHEPRLVVNSFFANDQRWVVEVSQSTSAFETADLEAPEFTIDDATVSVEPAGAAPIELSYTDTLTYETILGSRTPSSGGYAELNRHPLPGETYTVRVDAKGFPPVEATSRVPAPVPVTVTSAARRVEDAWVDPPSVQQERTITLRIQDPPGNENYYWVRIAQIGNISSSEVRFATRDRSIINETPTDLDSDGDAELRRAHFQDALFDGRTHEIDLVVEEFLAPDQEESPYPYFKVEFGVLSEDLYNYLVSVRTFEETDVNPFAEPINLHSNVESGYGLFAGRYLQTFVVPSEIVAP